jgi:hypothetical protein
VTYDYEGLEVFQLVRCFFDGNQEKAVLWMEEKNPLTGGVPPIWMVKLGRGRKLLRLVKEALRENEAPRKRKD